jgi:hypothetical protein
MARRITVVDDIDGTEPAETVSFALEGVSYTIDLAEKQRTKLRSIMQPFLDHATRVGHAHSAPKKSKSKSHSGGPDLHLNAVRDWANKNGYTVSYRGKVPQHVMDAFDAAHDAEGAVTGVKAAPAFSAAK